MRCQLVILVVVLTSSKVAAALNACTANDTEIQEPAGCPASGACSISKPYSVADGCVFDFAGRNPTFAPTAVLLIGSGTVHFVANDVTLAANASAGAYINARGQSATQALGGTVVVNATGNVLIQRKGNTRARIEVSGIQAGGTIQLTASGAITIAGRRGGYRRSAQSRHRLKGATST